MAIKRKATVTKRRKSNRKKIRLMASAAESKRPRGLMDEIGELYRPIKRPITLRLDADVLAWFKKQGRGYQTRINQALRKLMIEDRE
jgi:uncharacterized protein (DUF4415 family)